MSSVSPVIDDDPTTGNVEMVIYNSIVGNADRVLHIITSKLGEKHRIIKWLSQEKMEIKLTHPIKNDIINNAEILITIVVTFDFVEISWSVKTDTDDTEINYSKFQTNTFFDNNIIIEINEIVQYSSNSDKIDRFDGYSSFSSDSD